MKVLLNIDALRPPLTGIGNYTLQLAQGLERHQAVSSLLYMSRPTWIPTRKRTLRGGLLPHWLRRALRYVPYSYEARDQLDALVFRATTAAYREDYLYHEPNYIVRPYDGPVVVTVSDLSFIHYPEFHPKERVKLLEKHLEPSLVRARCVITHSEWVKQELVSLLGLPAKKVHAVSIGVDPAFHPRDDLEMQPVLRRYGLEGRTYLLSVATLEPRKNLHGLIRAYGRLPRSLRQSHPLVIAGHKGWQTAELERALSAVREEDSVRWLGFVDAAALPVLYAGARGFAYPSFYEGFGLPLAEAMASGLPVLTSNRAAMPEVVGTVGLLADPENDDDITENLRRLLEDDAFRDRAQREGPLHARKFNWYTTIDETLAVYRRAIGLNGNGYSKTPAPRNGGSALARTHSH